MKFKDVFLINERKVELDGKVFKSEKEAGFYLGSIGKTYEEIMKLLDVPERMAKYYANTGKKKGLDIPSIKKVEPKLNPIVLDKPHNIETSIQKLASSYKEPEIKENTALPINYKINLDLENMKRPINDEIYQTTFEKELITRKDGAINSTIKNHTFAVAMINSKPIYTPEDVPEVQPLNADLNNTVERMVQNQKDEVYTSLKYLPHTIIDIMSKSKVFDSRKVFIKSSETKNGGKCFSSRYKIFWGKRNIYAGKSFATLRHEMFHMLDSHNYLISNKIPDVVLNADISKIKTPSAKIKRLVDDALKRVDYGAYKLEANKILKNYDLSVEELELFIKYDKSDTMDLKSRGAFAFALYLSQGDLTNAFKSLYQRQIIDIDRSIKWVDNITHTELVFGYICDFIGSLTGNKVLGRKHGGYGHTTAYFNKRKNGISKNCELIADYGSVIGCDEGVIARKILKAFAPYTVNAIEAILKTQTYINHEGLDVNYI